MKTSNEEARTEQGEENGETPTLKLRMKELKNQARRGRAAWMPWSPT